MNVEEVFIGKKLSDEELAHAMAYTFHLPPEKVAVVPELSGDEDLSEVNIICQNEEIEGQFFHKVQIFGYNSDDPELFGKLLVKLAKHLDCDCLTPDSDSFSPFDMIRVTSSGKISEERLSTDQFEKEQFILEAS